MNVFVFVLICLVIFFVVRMKRRRVYIKNDKGFVEKGVLSKKECEELINIAKKYKFETKPDGVDDEPEYQIDVVSDNGINWEIWEKCKPIYLNKLKPIISSTYWIPEEKRINYIFLRRYTPDERTHIPLHQDENYFTMSFLLSDPNDFEGGELFVFDLNESNEMEKWVELDETTTEQSNTYIKSHPNLPILDYKQGDLAVYMGSKNYHGTLPVTSGERYVLTFFFS